MKFSKLFYAFFIILILSQRQAFADKKSYIVYLGGHSHGPEITAADLHRVTNSHVEFLSSFLESQEKAKDAIFYSYKRHINGFAAMLEEEEAANIAKHPDVVSVFPNGLKKLQTTHSWDFLGLEKNGVIHRSSLWKRANFGENIIIANIDSGVWPESESFSDNGYGPIPPKWKGVCVNNTKTGVPCNRKLIGARYFNKGYIALGGNMSASVNTTRDEMGHGTHTLSTAGGNFVRARMFGEDYGIAKGGSPRARVAAYKACWADGCTDADILKAFDYAIHDGVDVISVSLGSIPFDLLFDSIAIAAFHAMKHNIVVAASAGNSGPFLGTVTNIAPWIITVAANTIDRKFETTVVLQNGLKFKGESISKSTPAGGRRKYYPLIDSERAKNASAPNIDALLCQPGSLDPKKVKGKIVLCLRGENSRVEKGNVAAKAGAVGMILCNTQAYGDSLDADPHFLPASFISYNDSISLYKYMNSTRHPKGYITSTVSKFGIKPSPAVAGFSSRGPNMVNPDILKPDITAPGVNILASYAEDVSPTELPFDNRRTPFNVESGTSMSCPHVSGVVGLLKSTHPDWSPAAIRSAIMTTARTRDNTGHPMEEEELPMYTDPFGYGAGHIQPNRAMDPGLVYDLTVEDHLNFLCAIGHNETQIRKSLGLPFKCSKNFSVHSFNYPSITVRKLVTGKVTVTRKLKNVGSPGTYSARIHHAAGVSVSVEPEVLRFDKIGEEKKFKLTVEAKAKHRPSFVFGGLIWSDGHHHVRSPIVVGTGKYES